MKIEIYLSRDESAALERFAADFDFATHEAAGEAALRACLRGHGYLGAPTDQADAEDKTSSSRKDLVAREPTTARLKIRGERHEQL